MEPFKNIQLEQVKVATPCSSDWDKMSGDERVRFCSQCKLHVYNLSDMSRKEAADLIKKTEAKICIRMYRRLDGTIISEDCPVGLRRIRNGMRKVAGFIGLIFAYLSACPGAYTEETKTKDCSKSDSAVVIPTMGVPMVEHHDQDYEKTINQMINKEFYAKYKGPGPKFTITVLPDGATQSVQLQDTPGTEQMNKDIKDLVIKMHFPPSSLPERMSSVVNVDLTQPLQ